MHKQLRSGSNIDLDSITCNYSAAYLDIEFNGMILAMDLIVYITLNSTQLNYRPLNTFTGPLINQFIRIQHNHGQLSH